MKRILLLFAFLLIASPARADDLGGNIYWNSTVGAFQALAKTAGFLTIPACVPWTSYTPTVTQAAGTPSAVSCTARYSQCWKTVSLMLNCSLTTGASATDIIVSLPVSMSANAATNSIPAYCRQGGTGRACEIDMGTTTLTFFSDMNGSNFSASSANTVVRADLVYESN